MKKLALLFKETFLISMCTFGGGYVIVPLIKKKFVDDLELIDDDEMLDMVAIAQSAPGAIAINVAIILGYKIAGFAGALVGCFSTALPPLIIITIVSVFYEAFRDNILISKALMGMSAGVSAIIMSAVVVMMKPMIKSKVSSLIIAIGFVLAFFINAIYLIIGTIVLGSIYTYYSLKKQGEI